MKVIHHSFTRDYKSLVKKLCFSAKAEKEETTSPPTRSLFFNDFFSSQILYLSCLFFIRVVV